MREPIAWDGRLPITQPGFYSGIPLKVYHSQKICPGPSVSSSGLRRVLEINGGSPAHFYAEWSGNPNMVEADDREAWILGRAAHHMLLGQPDFARYFVVRPPHWDSYRTKEARQWRDSVPKDQTILTDGEVKKIAGMAESLGKDVLVRGERARTKDGKEFYQGLLNGWVECSGFWQDRETGLWIKIRPDAVPPHSGQFCDLKTTLSVQRMDIDTTLAKYGYHQQGALLAEGAPICLDMVLESFALIFVEKMRPPHCVQVVQVGAEDLLTGHEQNHSAMRLIARCIRDNNWPGPGAGDVYEARLPEWYRKRAQMLLADEKRGL